MNDESDGMRLEDYELGLADKTFLFHRNIKRAYKIGDKIAFMICENRNVEYVTLKFSYAGNIQYHKIENNEIKKLIYLLETVNVE